jgi:hypothetical protein
MKNEGHNLPRLIFHRLLLVRPNTVNSYISTHHTLAAEKALAVLNLRLIGGSEPPALLFLSPSHDQSPFTSGFTGNPRLVKSLPLHYTDLQLYALIRPFGALASARIDHTLGGVVQFWDEDSARAAEAAIRFAFSRTSKMALQAYDPCNVFCVVSFITD